MDALRKRKGKYQESLDDVVDIGDGQIERQVQDPAEGPEALLLRKELGGQIEIALEQLPPLSRSLIILRDVQGHSYEEMSEILDLPEGTVKSRLFRGRAKLKTILLGVAEQNLGGQRQ
jgi:RNA polymerase sigma-70 factor (ECF subfamily)